MTDFNPELPDPSPVLEGDLVDPVPAHVPVPDGEIIDADIIDEERANETVPEYVVVAEPELESDVDPPG